MCHKQRCDSMVILTDHEMLSIVPLCDLLLTHASRNDEDSHPNVVASPRSSVLKCSNVLQILLNELMHIKAGLYDEIRACALSVVRQIQHSDHGIGSTADSTLSALAVHGKFHLNCLQIANILEKPNFVELSFPLSSR